MSSTEAGKIARRAGIVGILTLGSRILGLVRDTFIAHLFGAGYVTDAFYMAFTIPNTFRQLVAEGSLTVAFLPVFSEVRHNEGEEAARKLVSHALGFFPLLVALLVTLGVFLAEPLTYLFAKGYQDTPGKFELTVSLTQWLFPYLWCAAMVALSMGILNAVKRFAIPAAAPALFNAMIIIVAYIYYYCYSKQIYAIVAGILAGGAAQVLLQIYGLKKANLLVMPKMKLSPPVKRILYLMLPTLLGTSIYELNILMMRFFVSHLEEGSLSYLYNADRFTQLPLGIFGFAIATASLPSLADYAAKKDFQSFKQTLSFAIRISNYIIFPACIALVILDLPIIATVFQHGAFDHTMAKQTASALDFYVVGLGAVALVRMTVQGFFAIQDTRTPVACAALGLAVNATCALAFIDFMSFRGLALALGCAAWFQLIVLQILLARRIGALHWREILSSALKSLIAAAIMGAAIYHIARLGSWEQGTTIFNILILGITVFSGLGIYLLATMLLKSSESEHLLQAVKSKLFRR